MMEKKNFKSNYLEQKKGGMSKTRKSRYEMAVDEYKAALDDKTHPDNRTASYKKNQMAIFNRLLTAADELDAEDPGAGIFGLIALALSSSLALKDKNIILEKRVKDLELRAKRLEKR